MVLYESDITAFGNPECRSVLDRQNANARREAGHCGTDLNAVLNNLRVF
jgi:hypothetical protein